MNTGQFLFRGFIRLLVVAFWGGVIFLFLFAPRAVTFLGPKKSLTIFTFPLLVDAQRLAEFEARTGIKLYIHYYENNDELLAKLYSAGGDNGYDIIFPSDYAVKTLLSKGTMLQKIDRSRLNFWKRLNPKLLGHSFDPKNEYSIPYQWEIYGVGFNQTFFGKKIPDATWRLVFDERVGPDRVGMINNAREVVALASLYLFGKVKRLNNQELEQVKKLLIEQKKRVEVYTDLQANYLLYSKMCPIAVCTASDIWREDVPDLGFFVPREGGFVVIDNICVPTSCKNVDIVYQFINFLYESDVMTHHADLYAIWPTLLDVQGKEGGRKLMEQSLKKFDTFQFFRHVASEQQLDDLWIALKAQ